MKALYLDLFINKEKFSFSCERYVLAKQIRVPYSLHTYLPSKYFQMLHSDI
jgi:hypothetical protein